MSVWASRGALADDGLGEQPPLRYGGSHIIPSLDGVRGGRVDTAHIPGFITRDGQDNGTDDEEEPWWPFLRLSVTPAQRPTFSAYQRLVGLADRLAVTDLQLAQDVRLAALGEDTVVLDVVQVDALLADLTRWRAGVGRQC